MSVDELRDSASAPSATKRRAARSLPLIMGVLFVVLGLFAFGAAAVAPATVDRIMGELKVELVYRAREWLNPGHIPEITLGGEGGIRELDQCTGEFIELVGYRAPNVLPLFAAHNNCGGDVILRWKIGQQVTLVGSDVIYEVVEERHTPKWSNTDQLEGMAGEFMVQTCYYGENRMRFLSLRPVGIECADGALVKAETSADFGAVADLPRSGVLTKPLSQSLVALCE